MLITVWFLLWALLWGVYFMLDGFDLGAGALLPFLAKSESDRRQIYNSVGPFWDGNEVWLITAGGVTFAAFPLTYAIMFSSLYSPLMLILFALIIRGAALGLRFESGHPAARRAWDFCFFAGSLAASLLLGVAFANLFRGLPLDGEGRFHGTILTLLNPYGLIGGALFTAFFMMHGLIWIALKTGGELEERAQANARKLWYVVAALAVVFDAATACYTPIWGAYLSRPLLFVIPILNAASLVLILVFMSRGAWWKAWFSSSAFIVTGTFFGTAGIWPDMLRSSLDPAFSITAARAASSPHTLKIMLGVAAVFVPLVIAYQAWVHLLFRNKTGDGDYGYGE